MSGSGPEFGKVESGVEEDEKYPHQGGGEAMGVCIFFKAVVQAVLLFGAETWVVTSFMGTELGGFQYQVEQRLKGQRTQRREDRN